MPPAPITANMSNFDPIPRLQQIAATIENGGHFDSPATAAHYINCAIKEIERLRQENATLTAERDEARRELCRIESSASGDPNMTSRAVAADLGWDCYEDGK